MLSANNLLRPQDGRPTMVPDQDMILGCYYFTILRENEPGAGKAFSSPNEALVAYQSGDVGIHAPIRVRVSKEIDGKLQNKVVETTVGRIIFNEPIPQDLGFVDRTNPETMFNYEVNFRAGKKQLEDIIRRAIAKHGFTRTAELLDNIKALGFKYSTKGAITISISDMTVPRRSRSSSTRRSRRFSPSSASTSAASSQTRAVPPRRHRVGGDHERSDGGAPPRARPRQPHLHDGRLRPAAA